jgi:hypothetical protein
MEISSGKVTDIPLDNDPIFHQNLYLIAQSLKNHAGKRI